MDEMENVEKVTNEIYVLKSMDVSSANSIIILDEVKTLIGTGIERNTLSKFAEEVDLVLNSHFHYDHISNAGVFEEVQISGVEAPALEGPENYMSMCGISDSELIEKMKNDILNDVMWPKKVKPYSTEGSFDLGETEWEVIHTPGHSPGHCCFHEKQRDILFVGDYGPEKFGPWYGWPSCDLPYIVKSIERIIDMDPELILSSHTDPIREDIVPQMKEYLGILKERDEKISELHEEGAGIEEILDENIIYDEETKSIELLRFFAETMISKHLETDIFD